MKKITRKIALLLAGMMLLLTMSACGGKSDDTVTIGYIGDLSGPDAYVGVPPQLMLEDYIEDLNANGGLMGKKVKLVAYDMAADNATESVNITNRFINEDHVIAIIGPSSSSAARVLAPFSIVPSSRVRSCSRRTPSEIFFRCPLILYSSWKIPLWGSLKM